MWPVIFSALSVLLATSALLTAWHAVRIANRGVALPPARLRSVESKLQSLEDSAAEQSEAMLTMANRLKMIKVRSASTHAEKNGAGGMPDPYQDPDGWRRAMTSKLALAKLNGGS